MAERIARYEDALWRIIGKPKEQSDLFKHLKGTGQEVTERHEAEFWAYRRLAHVAADALDLNGYQFAEVMGDPWPERGLKP